MENIKIFACKSAEPFTQKICDYLGIEMGKMKTTKFKNDNTFIQIEETVREQDVYIVQTTTPPVNERVMELLIAIDALKRASARKINVVLPYYIYSRSDKKDQPRVPVTAKLMAEQAIIFDDEVDTAGSLIETANILEREGAKEIYAGCTHGVLSANAVERIQNSPIKELVITDTIPLTEDKKIDKIKIVSMVPLFAETIKRLNESRPIGEILKIY